MSTKLSLVPSAAPAQHSHHDRCKVRKLAETLRITLNIPPGQGLVMVLGHGGERNNLEALETWVALNLRAQGLHPNRTALQPLISALEAYLTDWEADS